MTTISMFKKWEALIIRREGWQVTLTIPFKSILHAAYHMQVAKVAGILDGSLDLFSVTLFEWSWLQYF